MVTGSPDARVSLLLNPVSVAVVGASAKRSSAGGNLVIRNLQRSDFSGQTHVVNPGGGTIEGIESVRAIAELPQIDVAVVCVPAPGIAEALRELDKIGCTAAIVPSAGLLADDIRDVQDAIADIDMLVHGPNCMGVINVSDDVPLWIGEGIVTDLPRGTISLIAQSGSAAIFVARTVTAGGFAKMLSTGNEYGIDAAQYIEWLAYDVETSVIGVVLESIRDGEAFARAVRIAQDAGKSVVVLKVGRTEAGGRATAAHTGALLAASSAYDALFESLGVATVADYDELASSLELIAALGGRAVDAGRIGAVTISGGQAALVADLAEEVGVALPVFSDALTETLTALIPDIAINNPLDAGGSVVAEETSYSDSLRLLAADPDIDVVMAVLDAQASQSPTEIEYEREFFEEVCAVSLEFADTPFVVASSSSVSIYNAAAALFDTQVPVIRGPRNAMIAVRSAAAGSTAAPAPVRPKDLPDEATVAAIRESLADGVTPAATRAALDAYEIPFVRSAFLVDIEGAAEWARREGYPVVLKIDSPDIGHRTEVGGVEMDIASEAELREAASRMLASVAVTAPGARITGFEIQEQLNGSLEAFVGFVSSPGIGVTVAVGSGGVLIELLRDVQQGLAPLSRDRAVQLIAATDLRRLADSYRSLHPKTDLTAYVALVERMSWLAHDLRRELSEADFNPVLIEHGTGRVRVVDALLVGR